MLIANMMREILSNIFIVEIAFWFDMLMTLNTGYIHSGDVELDRKKIVQHYILSGWFAVDFLGNFPFYAFASKKTSKGIKLLKWLKLNKLLRVGKLVRYLKDYVKFASIFRNTSFMIIFVHVVTCAYIGDAYSKTDLHSISMWTMYYKCLREVFAVSLGLGVVDEQNANVKPLSYGLFFAILLVGAAFVFVIQADIVVLLSSRTSTMNNFRMKLEKTKTELDYYDINEELSARVLEYYDYLWFNQLHLDSETVLKDPMLSATLRRELILSVYDDVLTSTPFLSVCSPDCLSRVAAKLVNTIAMPADYIVEKGDVGRELFILKNGTAGVFNDGVFLKLLRKGQFFGEVALVSSKYKKRTASIRALTVCELCVLFAKDFHELSAEYPELVVNMTTFMHTHFEQPSSDTVKKGGGSGGGSAGAGAGGGSGNRRRSTQPQPQQDAAVFRDRDPLSYNVTDDSISRGREQQQQQYQQSGGGSGGNMMGSSPSEMVETTEQQQKQQRDDRGGGGSGGDDNDDGRPPPRDLRRMLSRMLSERARTDEVHGDQAAQLYKSKGLGQVGQLSDSSSQSPSRDAIDEKDSDDETSGIGLVVPLGDYPDRIMSKDSSSTKIAGIAMGVPTQAQAQHRTPVSSFNALRRSQEEYTETADAMSEGIDPERKGSNLVSHSTIEGYLKRAESDILAANLPTVSAKTMTVLADANHTTTHVEEL